MTVSKIVQKDDEAAGCWDSSSESHLSSIFSADSTWALLQSLILFLKPVYDFSFLIDSGTSSHILAQTKRYSRYEDFLGYPS